MEVVGQVKDVALKARLFVSQQWQNRLVQVSVFAGIVFWILSSVPLIEEADKLLSKTFEVKVGKEGTRGVHAVVFALVMYVVTRFLLDPVVKKLALVEGLKGKGRKGRKNSKPKPETSADKKLARLIKKLAPLINNVDNITTNLENKNA